MEIVIDIDENEFDECWGDIDREIVKANREFDKKRQRSDGKE